METGGPVPQEWCSEIGEVLLGSTPISHRITELGVDISRDYDGKNPVLVVVLKGSFVFAADLSRALTIPHRVEFIRARSYEGDKSTGAVQVTGLEGVDLANEHVIIVEDIVDTGLTLKALTKRLADLGAASVVTCSFLMKMTSRRQTNTPDVRYAAFDIPDKFVVGYGLDYDQRYRHLPFVGVVKK